jgi:hypothetical protein
MKVRGQLYTPASLRRGQVWTLKRKQICVAPAWNQITSSPASTLQSSRYADYNIPSPITITQLTS